MEFLILLGVLLSFLILRSQIQSLEKKVKDFRREMLAMQGQTQKENVVQTQRHQNAQEQIVQEVGSEGAAATQDMLSPEGLRIEKAHKTQQQYSEGSQEVVPEAPPAAPAPDVMDDEYEKFYDTNPAQQAAQAETMHTDTQTQSADTPSEAPTHTDKMQSDILSRFFTWLHKDWPMKIGGFLMILAVGWFVTYAADQGWLSETARVVLGYLFGTAMLSYGAVRAQKVQLQGNTFIVIGVAAIFIATLAATIFDTVRMSEVMALILMLVTVGLTSLIALKQRNSALVTAIIFFGAIIPLFFFEGAGIEIIFFYLLALTVGTLWIVAQTQWRSLTALMLVVVLFYAIGYTFTADSHSLRNIILALVFAVIFYAANVAAIITSQKVKIIDVVTAVGVGIMYLLFVLMFAQEQIQVFLLLVGVLFFALASYAIFTKTQNKMPTALYGGVSLILIVISTGMQFEGSWLATAYIIEAAVMIMLTIYILRDRQTTNAQSLTIGLYVFPMLALFGPLERIFDFIAIKQGGYVGVHDHYGYADVAVMNVHVEQYFPDLFALLVAVIATLGIVMMIMRFIDLKKKDNLLYMRIFAYLALALFLIFIWVVPHMFLASFDAATFIALFIYTVMGVAFYVMGAINHYKPYRFVGALLFAIVLTRIFTIEFWQMDMPVRIVTFFVLGALLISTAFFARSKKSHDNK